MTTTITNEQAEQIAAKVYARMTVDSTEAAFRLDWELVRAGVFHANAPSIDDSCHHGKAHIVNDCLRCGAPVCCGKCCADDSVNEFDLAGEIAYQLTKKLVIDMPTARAAVDAAIAKIRKHGQSHMGPTRVRRQTRRITPATTVTHDKTP